MHFCFCGMFWLPVDNFLPNMVSLQSEKLTLGFVRYILWSCNHLRHWTESPVPSTMSWLTPIWHWNLVLASTAWALALSYLEPNIIIVCSHNSSSLSISCWVSSNCQDIILCLENLCVRSTICLKTLHEISYCKVIQFHYSSQDLQWP